MRYIIFAVEFRVLRRHNRAHPVTERIMASNHPITKQPEGSGWVGKRRNPFPDAYDMGTERRRFRRPERERIRRRGGGAGASSDRTANPLKKLFSP